MKGPFTATVDLGAPFEVQSEPCVLGDAPAASGTLPGTTPRLLVASSVVGAGAVVLAIYSTLFRYAKRQNSEEKSL